MRFLEQLAFPGWRFVLAAFVVVVAGGYYFFGRGASMGATLVIAPGNFNQHVNVSGSVIAAKDVDLGFAANGRISATFANVGQHVPVGTILAQIENGDLIASLEQKRSALAEAQANLASLQAGTRPEEISVATAAVANAKAALIDAIQSAYTASDDAVHNKVDSFFTNPRVDPKLSFITTSAALKTIVEQDRVTIEPTLIAWALLVVTLSNENVESSAKQAQTYSAQVTTLLADANLALNQAVPNQTVSSATISSYAATLATARTAVNSAATALTTDISALNSAQTNLALKQAGPTSENIAAQKAIVAAAQANVGTAQAELGKSYVSAPFAGTVTRMDAKAGEIVSPTTSLISMQSDGLFQIETFVPEVAIAGVVVGNPATTTLDAFGTAVSFPAKVVAVDPAETMKDGVPAYKTTLSFLSEDSRIRSGMTANVVIEIGVLHDAIVIPSGTVGTKNDSSYVSVVEHNTAVARAVTTGPSPALGQIQILSGLSAGDVILLTPAP
ncbi:MAG: efflux RND transporter periplasmic adaptor subunit [Minisyncoccia bacterium]